MSLAYTGTLFYAFRFLLLMVWIFVCACASSVRRSVCQQVTAHDAAHNGRGFTRDRDSVRGCGHRTYELRKRSGAEEGGGQNERAGKDGGVCGMIKADQNQHDG